MIADPDPLSRLPHGEASRLLTSATLDRASGTARGVRDAGPADPRLNAAGYLPQSLLIELMGQTAGLALPGEQSSAFIAAIDRIHLHRAARGGERVTVTARLSRRVRPIFLFTCRAESAGVLLAHGSISLRAL